MITSLFLLSAISATNAAPANLTLDAWISQVNGQIAQHAEMPKSAETGMATVSFRRDENGRPADLKVRANSPTISRAALNTLKAMDAMPRLPSYLPANQRVSFKFLIGGPEYDADYHQALDSMMTSAKRDNLAVAARFDSKTQLALLEHR